MLGYVAVVFSAFTQRGEKVSFITSRPEAESPAKGEKEGEHGRKKDSRV